jgi:hypothetical protein
MDIRKICVLQFNPICLSIVRKLARSEASNEKPVTPLPKLYPDASSFEHGVLPDLWLCFDGVESAESTTDVCPESEQLPFSLRFFLLPSLQTRESL